MQSSNTIFTRYRLRAKKCNRHLSTASASRCYASIRKADILERNLFPCWRASTEILRFAVHIVDHQFHDCRDRSAHSVHLHNLFAWSIARHGEASGVRTSTHNGESLVVHVMSGAIPRIREECIPCMEHKNRRRRVPDVSMQNRRPRNTPSAP